MRKLLFTFLILSFVLTGCFLKKLPAVNDAREKQGDNQVEKNINKQEEEKIENNKANKEDLTADWKTYRNEEYGFEVKYPKEWVVDNSKKTLFYLINKDRKNALENNTDAPYRAYDIVIEVKDELVVNGKKYSIQELIKDKNIFNFSGYLKVDSVEAVDGVYTMAISDSDRNILFEKDNKVFEFTINSDGKFTKNILDISNQVLNSFKFINTNETANWKTYRNEEFGFEVKMSDGWSDYSAKKVKDGDNVYTIIFEHPNRCVFGIFICPIKDWEECRAEKNPNELYWCLRELGRNEKYVFHTGSSPTDCPDDKLVDEVKNIYKSFQIDN